MTTILEITTIFTTRHWEKCLIQTNKFVWMRFISYKWIFIRINSNFIYIKQICHDKYVIIFILPNYNLLFLGHTSYEHLSSIWKKRTFLVESFQNLKKCRFRVVFEIAFLTLWRHKFRIVQIWKKISMVRIYNYVMQNRTMSSQVNLFVSYEDVLCVEFNFSVQEDFWFSIFARRSFSW